MSYCGNRWSSSSSKNIFFFYISKSSDFIKNLLFSHFLTEDTFDLNFDLSPIVLNHKEVGENVVAQKAPLFKCALDELARNGVLTEAAPGLYILTQPISAFSQMVALSPIAAEMIADLLEEVGMSDDERPYRVNKMAITSDDISALCHVCHLLLEESDGSDDDESGEPFNS